MKIEIDYSPYKKEYKWKLWTGPDGIDDYYGVCNSLGECFQQIIKNDTLNMLNYIEDIKPKKMNEYEQIKKDLKKAFIEAQQTEEWKELQRKIDSDKIVEKIIEERKAQKLWNRLQDELGFTDGSCDKIVDLVEDWILDEQNSCGSQNINTELLVEGFNDAIRKMKEMLS